MTTDPTMKAAEETRRRRAAEAEARDCLAWRYAMEAESGRLRAMDAAALLLEFRRHRVYDPQWTEAMIARGRATGAPRRVVARMALRHWRAEAKS